LHDQGLKEHEAAKKTELHISVSSVFSVVNDLAMLPPFIQDSGMEIKAVEAVIPIYKVQLYESTGSSVAAARG
jgi:hypothetical protein